MRSGRERGADRARRPGTRRTRGRVERGGEPEEPFEDEVLDDEDAYVEPRPPRRWVLPSVLAVVTALVLVAYFTPVLGVRSVEVQGATTLPEQRLLDLAAVPMGEPMLQVDSDAITRRLREEPLVASAEVALSWPSTVRIDIAERVPVVYAAEGTKITLYDGAGVAFATVRQPPPELPELRLRTAKERDAATGTALQTLTALTPDVRAEVTAVVANGPNAITLELTGNRRVEWGSATDSQRKAQILPPLLTRPGTVYDVTSPALPTVA